MTVRLSALLALLAAVLAGCNTSAPGTGPAGEPAETYTLKIREKQPGEKYAVAESVVVEEAMHAGTEPPRPMKKASAKKAYTEEVLAVENGVVTKSLRAYTAAEGLYHAVKFAELVPLSYAGKTVAIERKGKDKMGKDQFSFAFADGTPIGLHGAFLNSQLSGEPAAVQALLPTSPVKVGGTWEIPTPKVREAFGPFTVRSGTGTLVRVGPKDGKLYGVVSVRLLQPGGRTEPGEVDEWTFEGCLDGTATDGTTRDVRCLRGRDPEGKPDRFTVLTNNIETTVKPVK